MFDWINRAMLARYKRRRIRQIDEWLKTLHDQVESGKAGIAYYEEKRARLNAEVMSHESSRTLLRGTARRQEAT